MVLVIGQTGSGKTTTILKFLGYDFKEDISGDTKKYVVDGEVAADHESFHCGVERTSCTSALNAVEIPMGMQTKIPKSKHNVPRYIADTPGFGDSRGFEQDRTNAQRIISTLREEEYINCVCLIINGRQARKYPNQHSDTQLQQN